MIEMASTKGCKSLFNQLLTTKMLSAGPFPAIALGTDCARLALHQTRVGEHAETGNHYFLQTHYLNLN